MSVSFTFVHAADLHFDSPFKGLAKVPEAVRERLRESTFVSFRNVVDAAIRENADFVVLAGDLYDMADRSLRAQLRLQRMLTDLVAAGIGIFIVHGNHDPESGRKARLDWPEGVCVFGSGEAACREARRRDGTLAAHVYGISYPTPAVTDNLAHRFVKREGAPFHLALLHCNVDGNASHDDYAPCRLSDLTAAGFDYWALGHVHDRRVLHEYPHVVYPGNIQGRSVRETGPKGAYVVKVSDTGGISMSFCDTADVLWQESIVTIEGAEREQQLKDRLLAAIEEARSVSQGRPVVLRLRLEGRGALHESLLREHAADEWLEQLREWIGPPELRDDWVWPESLSIHTAGEVDIASIAEDEGFMGELVRRGLKAVENPELNDELLRDATEMLRSQPRLREWTDSRGESGREDIARRALELAVSMLKDADIE